MRSASDRVDEDRIDTVADDAPARDLDAPIVDAHAHIFNRDMPLSATAWMVPDYNFTAEDYLKTLDAHGVHFGILSAISISGFYNDYTIAAARRHKRLRATAIVAPGADPYVLRQMRDDGVVGIRLQLARLEHLPDLADEGHQLLLRRVRDLDWHVHVAVEGPRLPPILDALERSGVKIVLDHFAHPDPAAAAECAGFQAALRAVDRGRTWIKLSAGFRLLGPESWQSADDGDAERLGDDLAALLLRQVGPDRLLWGSDCPFVGYEGRVSYGAAIARFHRRVPDPRVRRAISDTALRLYFA
jgi:predicted TIM-barrel fold metal-dependent hydrolase